MNEGRAFVVVKTILGRSYRTGRRLVVAVVGGTLVLLGLAMVVLPGPAVVVIPIGLGILSLEFAWARIWLRRVKTESKAALGRLQNRAA